MEELTNSKLNDLYKEIDRLRTIADQNEVKDRNERFQREQSQAEKEYEMFHIRKGFVDKYKEEFLPEYEKKVNDAVDKAMDLKYNPDKKIELELAQLEDQAKMLMADIEEPKVELEEPKKVSKKKATKKNTSNK